MNIPQRFEQILRQPIIVELAKLFKKNNFDLYLVGGSVRDLFLQRFHEDLDFTTNALPDEIIKTIKDYADEIWTIGKEYGTVGIKKCGLTIEITTFRADIYKPQDRHPQVTFSKTITEDLKRRDFTINAMALKLPEGKLVELGGSLDDLQSKVLKTPQEASKSFADDPLRMLRAVRFISSLGFKVDEETSKAIIENKERLKIVSKERIRDELSKLLTGKYPGEALRWLMKLNLSKYVVPEIPTLKMTIDPKFHHKDVLEHTFKVVQSVKPDLILRLAALLHDIAKPKTRSIINGKVHFYGHDILGAKMARKRMRELRYPKDVVEKVSKLIRLHLRPYTYAMGWTDSAVRRYARDAGDLLPRLNQLAVADCTTEIEAKSKRNLQLILDLEKRIKILNEKEEISKIRAPIDGKEIMKHLGIQPGRLVGKALKMLLDAKLDDKIKTKEEAYKLLDEWMEKTDCR